MCTAFALHQTNNTLVGNNEDIFLETGALFTNPRELTKRALILPPDRPLVWQAVYGSLTFSQVSKEFPSGGMNEAGLVVEQTTLRETEYPAADDRPAVKELQLIQYLLDTCQSVNQAIDRMAAARVAQANGSIHYFLTDRSGETAVVEYLKGKMAVYRGQELAVPALTNSLYPSSVQYVRQAEPFTAGQDDYERNSLERFAIAARQVDQAPCTVEAAFQLLEAVQRPDSIWSIVYDPVRLVIYVRTLWNRQTRTVDLARFDLSAGALGLAYDLRQAGTGEINDRFVPYSFAFNQQLARSFFRDERIAGLFGLHIPDELLDAFAAYPDQAGG